MLPGLLKHTRRNGVSELLTSDLDSEKIKTLVQSYRKKFYREPMGLEAYENAVMEEAMFISQETMKKAESFHQEFCLHCGKRAAIKLSNDGYNYFFICENKCC